MEKHLLHCSGHGSRQERCEMEQAGRILRAQASRKQVFHTILPLLSEGLIRPAEGQRKARKDHQQIKEQVRALRAQMHDAEEDADTFMAMTNVIEQACNVYLASPAPADRTTSLKWGAWLCCDNPVCRWNGARDYAASLNIACLGMAFLITYHETRRYQAYRMTDSSDGSVKPASYTGAGATLLLPSQGITPRPSEGKHIYYAGWSYSIALRTSHPQSLLAVLSTSRLRKRLLDSA